MEKTYLTVHEVAETLRINILTVYSYIKRGQLDAIRIGRYYRVGVLDLQKFIQQHRTNNKNTLISNSTD